MVAYGDSKGYSAMAKTVGLPAAIAAEMILEGTCLFKIIIVGKITQKGVIGPMESSIYEPLLSKLESLNEFKFIEKSIPNE
jgi:saccharopine dehydrogenase-like NADP-dependent oxidoreductase